MADPLYAQLPHTLQRTDFPQLGERAQGKVRDIYRRGDRLILVASDRLSAFDRVLTTIPYKGEVLNRLAAFWFEKTKSIVPNHVIDVPDPNVTVARVCAPFKVEVVVRGYLTGSLWRDYQSGAHTAYGLGLPPGLRKNERFGEPLITPSTKADTGQHDEPLSEKEVVARGLASARDWQRISEAARALFHAGQRWAEQQGLILVDTKYEFGKVGDALYAIDEIHTPDSSRYWIAAEYDERFVQGSDQRMLDKENIRQWLLQQHRFSGQGEPPAIPDEVRVELARKYLAAYQQLTGAPLALVPGDVSARIERNLRSKQLL